MTHYILIDASGKFLSDKQSDERPDNPEGKGWQWAAPGEEAYDTLFSTFIIPHKTEAILKTYADADSVIADAIGNRAQEYLEAEAAALAYQSAGFTGEVSPYISGYALFNVTGEEQSNEWSALQIIGRANAMRSAQLTLRNSRFQIQSDIRSAGSFLSLQNVVDTWDAFITSLRSQLGV